MTMLSYFRPVLAGVACWITLSGFAQPQVEPIVTVFAYPNADPYDRENHFGFNHAPNVATLADGTLIAAWFSGAHEGDVHQLILAAKSDDGGRTWSPAQPLVDIPRKSDFDPAFVSKGDRSWVLFTAGRWNRYPWVGLREAEKREIGLDSFRLLLMSTDDAGRTWSEPSRASEVRGFCRGNGIVLPDGRILFPIYDQAEGGKWFTAILRSNDDGETWERVGHLSASEGRAGGEPTITWLDNGDLLAALRSTDGKVWFARSGDAGETWGEPFAGEFEGAASSHSLLRTSTGRVFLAFNESAPPERSPLVLRELDQATMQWGPPIEIARAKPAAGDVWSSQVSYPSIAEAPDGALVVVWTEISVAPLAQSGVIRAVRVIP